jgi:hypothetical protein
VVTCFTSLLMAWPWEPIPGCPGRYVLRGGPPGVTLEDLVGEQAPRSEHRVPGAADPVVVVPLEDGGLISYRKPDGAFVHTLNSPDGFRRKLDRLGIPL